MNWGDLATYYADCHRALEGDGAASLQWAYDILLEQDFHWQHYPKANEPPAVNLASAYFQGGAEHVRLLELLERPLSHLLVPEEEERLFGTPGVKYTHSLKPAQRRAISNALEMPVSFVQGPPGTGKTAVIARLVALAAKRGLKVAVVSNNAAAVENVASTLELAAKNSPGGLLAETASKFALLGNSSIRASWSREDSSRPQFCAGIITLRRGSEEFAVRGWERKVEFEAFTEEYPIILSTIHSLRKVFSDGWKYVNKYDLLIMDEASQTRLDIGATVLGAAKRLVLFGDTRQLSPVMTVSDKAAPVLSRLDPEDTHCLLKPEVSFLSACLELWGTSSNTTMLVDHFRCAPGIIEFCNETIYNSQLILHAPNPLTGEMESVSRETLRRQPVPITISFYEGEYLERCPTKDGKPSFRNRKQISILQQEFGNAIVQQVFDGYSVALLSPFRGQAEELRVLADELRQSIDSRIDDSVDLTIHSGKAIDDDSEETIALQRSSFLEQSTVSRAQGREFDFVYLLPTEDGIRNPEKLWAQNKRVVNVAVSRAKRALYAIVSTRMLEPRTQLSLCGVAYQRQRVIADQTVSTLEKHDFFVCKLVEYTIRHNSVGAKAAVDPYFERGYGVFPSEVKSIFDKTLRGVYNVRTQGIGGKLVSRPQEAVTRELQKTIASPAFARFHMEVRAEAALIHFWDTKIPLHTWREVDKRRQYKFPGTKYGVHYVDIIVVNRDTGQIALAIEVDGSYHREPRAELSKHQSNDTAKDEEFTNLGGYLIRGNVIPDDAADIASHSFVAWRLPTDGSTYGESKEFSMPGRLSVADVLELALSTQGNRVIRHCRGRY